jgi:transposase
VEAHALREQGWTISAIARHLGHDRKTVRAYLAGVRVPEVRVRRESTVAEPFLEYCRLRLGEDPHLWASTLHDELVGLGFTGSYPSLTATIRVHGLRPHCEPCQASKGRDSSLITHPPGEETQWDWVELPNPPSSWGLGREAHLLVGSLAHSGRWRAVLADCEDFPHLIEALDRVTRKLGGLTRRWRFDSDGHGLLPGDRDGLGGVRPSREALRGRGRSLPAAARQPQGRGREGQPFRSATLVAHRRR